MATLKEELLKAGLVSKKQVEELEKKEVKEYDTLPEKEDDDLPEEAKKDSPNFDIAGSLLGSSYWLSSADVPNCLFSKLDDITFTSRFLARNPNGKFLRYFMEAFIKVIKEPLKEHLINFSNQYDKRGGINANRGLIKNLITNCPVRYTNGALLFIQSYVSIFITNIDLKDKRDEYFSGLRQKQFSPGLSAQKIDFMEYADKVYSKNWQKLGLILLEMPSIVQIASRNTVEDITKLVQEELGWIGKTSDTPN